MNENYSAYIQDMQLTISRNLSDMLFSSCQDIENNLKVNKIMDIVLNTLSKEEVSFIFSVLSTEEMELFANKYFLSDSSITNNLIKLYIPFKNKNITIITNDQENIKIVSKVKKINNLVELDNLLKFSSKLEYILNFAKKTKNSIKTNKNAIVDFGYLQSNLNKCGLGFEINSKVFLMATVLNDDFSTVLKVLREYNLEINSSNACSKDSLFDYNYIIGTVYNTNIKYYEKYEKYCEAIEKIIGIEDRNTQKFIDDNKELLKDKTNKAVAVLMNSLMLDYKELVSNLVYLKLFLATEKNYQKITKINNFLNNQTNISILSSYQNIDELDIKKKRAERTKAFLKRENILW